MEILLSCNGFVRSDNDKGKCAAEGNWIRKLEPLTPFSLRAPFISGENVLNRVFRNRSGASDCVESRRQTFNWINCESFFQGFAGIFQQSSKKSRQVVCSLSTKNQQQVACICLAGGKLSVPMTRNSTETVWQTRLSKTNLKMQQMSAKYHQRLYKTRASVIWRWNRGVEWLYVFQVDPSRVIILI